MQKTKLIPILLAALCAAPLFAQQLPDLNATSQTLGQDLFTRSGSTGMVLVAVRGKEVSFHSFGETAPGNQQTPTTNVYAAALFL